jgi:hypothetical protein
MTDSNKPQQRRRARKPDGSFKGDNPTTPDLNEAWEPTPVDVALPKEKYAPQAKVTSAGNNTAGKYSSSAKVKRPGLGKVTTTFF